MFKGVSFFFLLNYSTDVLVISNRSRRETEGNSRLINNSHPSVGFPVTHREGIHVLPSRDRQGLNATIGAERSVSWENLTIWCSPHGVVNHPEALFLMIIWSKRQRKNKPEHEMNKY